MRLSRNQLAAIMTAVLRKSRLVVLSALTVMQVSCMSYQDDKYQDDEWIKESIYRSHVVMLCKVRSDTTTDHLIVVRIWRSEPTCFDKYGEGDEVNENMFDEDRNDNGRYDGMEAGPYIVFFIWSARRAIPPELHYRLYPKIEWGIRGLGGFPAEDICPRIRTIEKYIHHLGEKADWEAVRAH